MADRDESLQQHLDSLLAGGVHERRLQQEYDQQRLRRLQRYRDIREQLEEAFTQAWCETYLSLGENDIYLKDPDEWVYLRPR